MKFLAKLLIAGVFSAIAQLSLAADDWLKSVPEFNLDDHLGQVHSLDHYQDSRFVVFYVQGNGCPISRIALPSLREVRAEFADRNIDFIAFNANIQDSMAAIRREAEEFNIDFPIMKDEGQQLAKALGVERTAEVFVVDPRSREVLFRGPINDKLGYETQRNQASEHYLKNALDTLLTAGTVDSDDIPESKGCLIAIF